MIVTFLPLYSAATNWGQQGYLTACLAEPCTSRQWTDTNTKALAKGNTFFIDAFQLLYQKIKCTRFSSHDVYLNPEGIDFQGNRENFQGACLLICHP